MDIGYLIALGVLAVGAVAWFVLTLLGRIAALERNADHEEKYRCDGMRDVQQQIWEIADALKSLGFERKSPTSAGWVKKRSR
jgi:hypothetical protein